MKIGIVTSDFLHWNEKRYDKMREAGFKYADFGMANTESELYLCGEADFVKRLTNELELAKKSHMKINQVHGPWRWPPRDSTLEDRIERMDKMKKSIYAASVLECKNWVVHPIMPFGISDKGTDKEKETWKLNIEFMKELLAEAKQYGVTVCVENMPMPDFSIASPEDILRLVKEVDDENFKICFDTGHAAICAGSEIGDEVRKLGKEIRVLHIHDNDGVSDLHKMPLCGIINWKDFNKSLSDIGFDGVFSLEMGPSERLPETLFDDMAKIIYNCANMIINNLI